MATLVAPDAPAVDAPSTTDGLSALTDFLALRRLAGLYPDGHPLVSERLAALVASLEPLLERHGVVCIEVIRDQPHVNGVVERRPERAHALALSEMVALGVDSIHFERGIGADELLAAARFLWQQDGIGGGPSVAQELARRGVRHVSVGRLVPLDTRWRARHWPDGPMGTLDPAYEEALVRAQETFDGASSGRGIDAGSVQETVQLLIHRVARSSAAMGHITAVKQYENLTWCHSVNVAMLSLLLGRTVGLDGATALTLVEAALLHDIGKTRVPLEVVAKPGALDRHERRQIEAHAAFGGEILAATEGLAALTPTVALEHHRSILGRGYPDLGDGVVPHAMSQIVSVADVYEALTGARAYKDPTPPERACAILARLAGEHLNPALVKAFIGTMTFFPVGSFVRTNREEVAVVLRTNPASPIRPVLAILRDDLGTITEEVDLADPGRAGARHIVETIPPPAGAPDLTAIFDSATGPSSAL